MPSRRPRSGEDSKWPHSPLKGEKGWPLSFLFFALGCGVLFFFGCRSLFHHMLYFFAKVTYPHMTCVKKKVHATYNSIKNALNTL